MLIALLALLGVNLIVIVVLLGVVLSRKRWVKRQAGSFHGAIKVSSGEIDGLRSKWRRGYGRWDRDVLVWTKGPFLFRNELVVVDGLGQRPSAGRAAVKRLGDRPVLTRLMAGSATVDVAVRDGEGDLVLGPYGSPVEAISRD
jgi:hypothetical protein